MNAEAKKDAGDPQSDVWNAISAFEQILDAMPNDRAALETLQEAYEKIGDQAQSLIYLVRLAKVIAEEADVAAAPGVLEKLKARSGDDESAVSAMKGLEQLVASLPKAAPENEARAPKVIRKKRIDITSEMSLAWNLLQANEISQEDYNNIVHDLTENSTRDVDSPVTVMHVIEDRQFKSAGRIMVYLSRESGMPVIPLSSFDLNKEAYSLLPIDLMKREGAIVFELMAKDALVAILNPYNTDLQKHVEESLGKKCHFYLVTAAEYDTALDKLSSEMRMNQQDADARSK